ncbi:hypothetical protein QBC35DRAFT_476959, partial [Podospora australis]
LGLATFIDTPPGKIKDIIEGATSFKLVAHILFMKRRPDCCDSKPRKKIHTVVLASRPKSLSIIVTFKDTTPWSSKNGKNQRRNGGVLHTPNHIYMIVKAMFPSSTRESVEVEAVAEVVKTDDVGMLDVDEHRPSSTQDTRELQEIIELVSTQDVVITLRDREEIEGTFSGNIEDKLKAQASDAEQVNAGSDQDHSGGSEYGEITAEELAILQDLLPSEPDPESDYGDLSEGEVNILCNRMGADAESNNGDPATEEVSFLQQALPSQCSNYGELDEEEVTILIGMMDQDHCEPDYGDITEVEITLLEEFEFL